MPLIKLSLLSLALSLAMISSYAFLRPSSGVKICYGVKFLKMEYHISKNTGLNFF
jgi:hypothetical protein